MPNVNKENEELLKQGKRRCSKCHEIKTLDQFYKMKNYHNGYNIYCKKCAYETEMKSYHNNIDKERERQRNYFHSRSGNIVMKRSVYKSKYGLSTGEVEEIYSRGCEICGMKIGKMCIDHDHKTGKLRGCLCWKCNLMLGQYDDNVEVFRNIISYLEKYSCG